MVLNFRILISLNLKKKKTEIIETIEHNYRIARRVYQQFISLNCLPILSGQWIRLNFMIWIMILKLIDGEKKKITDVDNAKDFMKIFQIFYQLIGRLPLSNGLLVIPDGDAPPGEDRVNMKSLYEMFKHKNSHGLVSLPFLGLIQYYSEKNDHSLTKSELTEPYPNLLYITLSGARDFRFETVSDLTAKLSFLLKHAIVQNIQKKRKNANT